MNKKWLRVSCVFTAIFTFAPCILSQTIMVFCESLTESKSGEMLYQNFCPRGFPFYSLIPATSESQCVISTTSLETTLMKSCSIEEIEEVSQIRLLKNPSNALVFEKTYLKKQKNRKSKLVDFLGFINKFFSVNMSEQTGHYFYLESMGSLGMLRRTQFSKKTYCGITYLDEPERYWITIVAQHDIPKLSTTFAIGIDKGLWGAFLKDLNAAF
jgi:hypothetical protein